MKTLQETKEDLWIELMDMIANLQTDELSEKFLIIRIGHPNHKKHEQCKDEAAIKIGYKNINEMFELLGDHTIKSARHSQLFTAIDEAAELYATSQIEDLTKENGELRKLLHDHNGMCQRKLSEQLESVNGTISDLTKEVEKLREFKRYVHDRLDKMSIPSDPEPESNASHGCRIEGRLNFVTKEVERLKAKQPFLGWTNDKDILNQQREYWGAMNGMKELKSSNDRYREALEHGIYDELVEEHNQITNVHKSFFRPEFVKGYEGCMRDVAIILKEKLSALHPLVKEGEK